MVSSLGLRGVCDGNVKSNTIIGFGRAVEGWACSNNKPTTAEAAGIQQAIFTDSLTSSANATDFESENSVLTNKESGARYVKTVLGKDNYGIPQAGTLKLRFRSQDISTVCSAVSKDNLHLQVLMYDSVAESQNPSLYFVRKTTAKSDLPLNCETGEFSVSLNNETAPGAVRAVITRLDKPTEILGYGAFYVFNTSLNR